MGPVVYSYERTKQVLASIKECSREIFRGDVEGGSMPADNVKPVPFHVSHSPREIAETFDAASSGAMSGIACSGLIRYTRRPPEL